MLTIKREREGQRERVRKGNEEGDSDHIVKNKKTNSLNIIR